MRHALTSILALYWMGVFAALAISCVFGADRGLVDAFGMLGFEGGAALSADTTIVLSGMLGFAFTVASATFLWVLATVVMARASENQDAGEVMRVAVCVAGAVLVFASAIAIFMSMQSVLAATGIQFAGLLGTYLAMDSVREKPVAKHMTLDEARLMALTAAKQYAMGRSAPSNVINFREKR